MSRALTGQSSVVVAPLSALMQKVVPAALFESYIETISIGDTRDRDLFTEKLMTGGYQRVPLVEKEGEFSLRGNIIDLFPPLYPSPFRMELIGDEIESIRQFDPLTQRSLKEVVDFTLAPAGEVLLSGESKRRVLRNLRSRFNESGVSRARRDRLIDGIEHDLFSLANLQLLPLFYGDLAAGGMTNGLGTLLEYLPTGTAMICESPGVMERAAEETGNEADRIVRKAEDEGKIFLEKEYFLASWEELLGRASS
ncbi:MAG: hypothetical protein JXI32_07465, partial [Deltaproteobacteria bacterium]|nr:hypothetical protein [Deltaproteobacteria bacterium]